MKMIHLQHGTMVRGSAIFEFGSDHRPGRFKRMEGSRYGIETLAYWVAYWLETYSYIINHLPQRGILLNYELLCEQSDPVWDAFDAAS